MVCEFCVFFFFQAEDGIRDHCVTGVQTCALPISRPHSPRLARGPERRRVERALHRGAGGIPARPRRDRRRVLVPRPAERRRGDHPAAAPRRRFHRETAWVTQPDVRVTRLLNASDELGVRVSQVLRGTSARVCMGLVMSSSKALLGLVDAPSQPESANERSEILKEEEQKLRATEREYRRTATRQAQLVYVAGALVGAIALTALVLLVLWLISLRTRLMWLPADGGKGAEKTVSLSLLYLCAIAGGLGAIVSLIARINMNSCTVDFEAGRGVTFALGALRPALGAVFGIAFYAAVVSGLLDLFKVPTDDETKQFYFFLVIAFLAGFSERWARDVLVDLDGGKPPVTTPGIGPA